MRTIWQRKAFNTATGERAMESCRQPRFLFSWGRTTLATCGIIAASLLCSPGSSDAQSNFYASKTITLVVGASVGGGYDVYARAFAPFLSAHIPGKPNVVVKNMPGAGGLASVLHLDAGAPKDGTVITTFNSGVLTNAFANPEQFKVDLRGLAWLGSLNRSFRFCYFWRGRGFSTWSDLNGGREATLGSIGVNSGAHNDIALLKHLLKANVRAVSGYPGRAEAHLAIERGELDGECGSKEGMPESWFAGNKIDIVVRMLEARSPEVPGGVPWAGEFLKTSEDLEVLRVLTTAMELGRPFVMSGQVPADRVAILQDAFAAATMDKQFAELANARNLGLSLVTGREAQQLLTKAFATPKRVVDRARDIIK
jgi:tripartite-type tricarboxylate transporter receptor subunit TctC